MWRPYRAGAKLCITYSQCTGTWKVMSLSATRKVTSAWPSRSLVQFTLKMELGVSLRRPSNSSNRYKRMSGGQNEQTTMSKHTSSWQLWIFCLGFHILAHTEYTLHSAAPFLAQDAVVGVKSMDKLLGGHRGESVLQQHKNVCHCSFSLSKGL